METEEKKSTEMEPKEKKNRAKKLMDDGPKFNYFWVYAIIFAFIIISFNLSFFENNAKESNFTELRQWLTDGDVDKIIVVNQKVAEIFITDSALQKSKFNTVARTRFGTINKGPQFYFTVASSDKFQDQMDDFYKDKPQLTPVNIKFETRQDWVRDT